MTLFQNPDRLQHAYRIGDQLIQEGSRDSDSLEALTRRISSAIVEGHPTAGTIILALIDMLATTVDASVGASLRQSRLDTENEICMQTEIIAGVLNAVLLDRKVNGANIKMTLGPDEDGTRH